MNHSSCEDSFLMQLDHPVVCIVGPTASGKTDVAQEVALQLGGEVVSADSMQIYRGMDIGTGKILPQERKVAHHGIDIVNPGQAYSASLFQDYARKLFRDIDVRGLWSVLAGGTGFYVRAAIDDYRFVQGNQTENPVREKYECFLEEHGCDALWNVLNEKDCESAAAIHPHNSKRVIRALEMLELEGKSYARQLEGFASMKQFLPARFFGLKVDPALLNLRIERRVDAMMEAGLVDEVKELLEAGFEGACTAKEAIGYKEIAAALQGECSLEDAVNAIKQATRRYAKRQRTWWRRDTRIHWLNADDGDVSRLTQEILDSLKVDGLLLGRCDREV